MTIIQGNALDVLRTLPDESVHCCVTSPPYWGLRDYGVDGQIGLEPTLEEYVERMVEIFREVRRVLQDDGTCWLNIGDSYCGGGRAGYSGNAYGGLEATRKKIADRIYGPPTGNIDGLKPKDLVGIPWRVAFSLQADGWYLRQDIIWSKPNPMPESVTDRCTKSHEYIFLLSKSAQYYYDHEAIKVKSAENSRNRKTFRGGGSYTRNNSFNNSHVKPNSSIGSIPNDNQTRNKRSVWTVATRPYPEAHFATFPPKLIEPCIKAGCPEGGTVLDPFAGSGTTGEVAARYGCNFIGIELKQEYIKLAEKRLNKSQMNLFTELKAVNDGDAKG